METWIPGVHISRTSDAVKADLTDTTYAYWHFYAVMQRCLVSLFSETTSAGGLLLLYHRSTGSSLRCPGIASAK